MPEVKGQSRVAAVSGLFLLSLLIAFLTGIHFVQSGVYQDSLKSLYGSDRVNGSYTVGGTPVHFVDSINGWDDVTGHINGSGIWIRTGRNAEEMRETCRHEFLHKFVHENTDYHNEEELVEALDSRVSVPECGELMERVESDFPWV